LRRPPESPQLAVQYAARYMIAALVAAALTGLCGLPTAWSALSVLPLALWLWAVARAPTPRQLIRRMYWSAAVYFGVQLFWLAQFAAQLAGLGPLGGLLIVPLYLIEGAFWALMAALVTWRLQGLLPRVWALAGGWVLLEWLRTLGPLAFPWSDLGYTLLPLPLVQTADLWGKLGLSALLAGTAAALVSLTQRQWRPAGLAALLWALGCGYGLTRQPQPGREGRAQLIRSAFDSFGRAAGQQTAQGQLATLQQLSRTRQPGEITIWSETAVQDPALLPALPGPGIYGVYQRPRNTAVSWDGRQLGPVQYDKLRPVPLGEYFPLKDALLPLYTRIFAFIGFGFDPPPLGDSTRPLQLNGVRYGTYICYDSIFSWIARQQALDGAQVLVNVSNDGWYSGWGVEQHFQMGRLRAIETRRWLLRAVNQGVVASVNDLGQPVQRLDRGVGALHVRYLLAPTDRRTVYMRLGEVPALLAALLMLAAAWRLERRQRWQRL
jgi:apolipoprotein N-acyltransferase